MPLAEITRLPPEAGIVLPLAPHSLAGGYVNFASGDDQAKVRDNFGAGYEQLALVKRAYDPGNVFHLNQNIIPA